jgi:phosphoglycolate phosphatase-like HAD superfamily hydrolase
LSAALHHDRARARAVDAATLRDMATLVIFDIDETLIETRRAWRGTFRSSVRRVLGSMPDARYTGFAHMTAAGMARELCERQLGRHPTAREVAAICEAQLDALRAAPSPPPPVRGAAALIERLLGTPGWAVAIGSGNFDAVARYKLRVTGFDPERHPIASSDDDVSRAGLIRVAMARAEAAAGHHFERTVYVGDASWDVETTRAMGLPLLGVAADGDGGRLRSAGVSHVVTDYRDPDHVLEALAAARVPA